MCYISCPCLLLGVLEEDVDDAGDGILAAGLEPVLAVVLHGVGALEVVQQEVSGRRAPAKQAAS